MSSTTLSFEEYWACFVGAHVGVATRRVQFVATSLGLAALFVGIAWRRGVLVVLAPAISWVPTWLAQRALEDTERPPLHAAFEVAANLKMWRMTLAGTMAAEVERVVADAEPSTVRRPRTPRPNMVTDHTLH